jgi:DNA-binding FadR family transcriptional regulator
MIDETTPSGDKEVLAILRVIAGGEMLASNSAARVALDLEEQFLIRGWPVGDMVGNAKDLRARMRMGKWTCREAIGILQMRGSALMRRGPGGGLIVAAPELDQLVRSIYTHLAVTHASAGDVLSTRGLIYAAAARMCIKRTIPRQSIAQLAVSNGESRSLPLRIAMLVDNKPLIFFVDLLEALSSMALTHGNGGAEDGGSDNYRLRQEGSLIAAIVSSDSTRAGDLALNLGKPGYLKESEPLSLLPAMSWQGELRETSYAGRLAARLVLDMLRMETHDMCLGTEKDIVDRYGFHLEVVRQAVRIIESTGLLYSQRGRGGGLRRRRPLAGPVIRQVATYLAAMHFDAEQSHALLSHLTCEASVAAARHASGEACEFALSSLMQVKEADPALAPHAPMQTEHGILNALVNPALAICIHSLSFHHSRLTLKRDSLQSILRTDFASSRYFQATQEVLRAIAAGDQLGARQAQEMKNAGPKGIV